MTNLESRAYIGQVVLIKNGRDAGQYAIIIEHLNDSFVLIADGDKRKFDRPKKKNMNHLIFSSYVSPEVRDSLLQTGRVTNGKLRHALIKFRSECLADRRETNKNGERRCN